MTKRILTGIKPTDNQIHLGNYFGAVKPMMELSAQYPDAEIFLFLAIMHGLTGLHDGKAIHDNSLNVLKIYMACGVDLKKFVIYNPADVPAHAQLSWVLGCITHMGFMERMHSYKEALDKGKSKEISVGVFTYPILMAADILLYDADMVPVGQDQKQHVEYARDIAQRFNNVFGETFKLPEPYIKPEVGTILGVDGRKMSKSYNNYIGLLDDEKQVLKRVKQIATDAKTVEEPKDPDQCNVYKICKLFLTPEEDAALRAKYQAGGLSYKEAKDYLYEKIMAFLKPIQDRYAQISDQEIIDLMKKNAVYVNELANKKLAEVYKKVGFTL
ncbi:Tryptophan-tRNA ligase [candidate division SR1 bacterium RAAC1_SR1_1]|nr:Tryptophan-tRNA ligase [candidate division SR1 bacterium RAAC1_SR1_1]